MSTDPSEKRPAPADKRRTMQHAPAESTARLGVTRRQMPQAQVIMQASDEPLPPDRAVATRRGCSSGLLAVIAMSVIVLSLVILALFLPPVSLWNTIEDRLGDDDDSPAGVQRVGGLAFVPLTADSPSVEADGLVISAQPESLGASFGVSVVTLPPADYLAENTPDAGWFCETSLPSGHALASNVYSLAQTGIAPARLAIQVAALADAATDPAALELSVWNAADSQWQFVAGGADETGRLAVDLAYLPRCVAIFRESESVRRAGVTLGLTDQFAPEVMAADVRLYPGSLRPTLSGALQVVLAPGFQTGQGYEVLPLLQNFDDPSVIDAATVQHILENPALRTEHARQIAAFVLSDPGYRGIVIDYREIVPDQRDAYTAFLRDLAGLLHGQGRVLTVVLPTPARSGDAWDTGAYDWPELGRVADEVVITAPLDPQAYGAGGPVDELLAWATTQISRGSLILGLSAVSVEDQGGGIFAPVAVADAFSYLGDVALDPSGTVEAGQTVTARLTGVQAEFGKDESAQTGYVRYLDSDGNVLRTMWITGPDALYFRMGLAARHNLGGVFVRDLMSPGVVASARGALLAYRLDQPNLAGGFGTLLPRWGVRAIDSWVVSEDLSAGQPFVFDVPDGYESVTVEAWVGVVSENGEWGAEWMIGMADLAILAPQPTPTPTSEPTAAPTATPEPTASPEQTPTQTPQEVTEPLPTAVSELASPTPGTGVEAPPAGPTLAVTPVNLDQPLPTVDPAVLAAADIGTKFEAGAQMGGVSSDIIFAGRMHLKWIKIDVHYLLGQDPALQQQVIDEVQANGFKVLLNVVGDPFEFAGTDRATYIAAYAAYVGALATNGADGIEVWRDMNGRMTAQEYVQLLAYAYQAIKTADPTTLVITGALRPVATAENPEEIDSTYYARLAEAGAAQYADCIGAQYVLGTVPPASTSGDPRGEDAIYYLPASGDGPRLAAGATRPLCYTRLGYLSPEGYPPLPEDYAWAQNITAAQQAEWVAEAVRLSKEGGQVRLVIIWGLEAAYFGGGSYEGGYAIIRPDGTCPACDLIEPLLKEPGTP